MPLSSRAGAARRRRDKKQPERAPPHLIGDAGWAVTHLTRRGWRRAPVLYHRPCGSAKRGLAGGLPYWLGARCARRRRTAWGDAPVPPGGLEHRGVAHDGFGDRGGLPSRARGSRRRSSELRCGRWRITGARSHRGRRSSPGVGTARLTPADCFSMLDLPIEHNRHPHGAWSHHRMTRSIISGYATGRNRIPD